MLILTNYSNRSLINKLAGKIKELGRPSDWLTGGVSMRNINPTSPQQKYIATAN